jgi:hypothetical protein
MDNKMRVKNNGGVFTLLTTLRSYPDNPDVVLSALKTLGNLVDLGKAELSPSLIISTAWSLSSLFGIVIVVTIVCIIIIIVVTIVCIIIIVVVINVGIIIVVLLLLFLIIITIIVIVISSGCRTGLLFTMTEVSTKLNKVLPVDSLLFIIHLFLFSLLFVY